jgi:predicted SAM-dependent methyltransferase
LKQLPGVRHARKAARKTRRAYFRHFGHSWLKRKLAASPRKRVVLGAWRRFDAGWIPTEREFLDLTNPAHWERAFEPGSVDAMLAEHVWEHLSPEEGLAAARTCFKYLKPGGTLRIAVPDGLHPDPAYIDLVKADAGGEVPTYGPTGNAQNHKALYTYSTLRDLFERAGFRVVLYEYFDEAGVFHCQDWDPQAGTIWRSKRFDPRNETGPLASVYPGTLDDYLSFSSLVLDAVKEQPQGK